ncbi:MAG: histidinol-phosphate transaminase [Gammaproteobacteria bacterium]|nr:MAG: histidinol-phosphate transaminase [Gammaproteobacteria bacterium]
MSDEIDSLVAHWVRPEIRRLTPYQVQDASGLVKLDAMENPYTWPEALRDEWADLLRQTDVNRYPDPAARSLTERLAECMDVPEGMQVILGNGSDEIIQMIGMSLSGPGRCVLSVEPGFVMYRMISTFCGMPYVGVPLGEDFSLDMAAIRQAMDEHQPAVVYLAYPNNPTGNLFDEDAVCEVIEAAPGLVVVDEAYAPFTDASFLPRLGAFDNLVVMRTVSKMGLAGLRLGFLAGPPAWLAEFDKVRLPYNINVLTQVSAEFALRHKAVFDEQTARIREERGRLATALAALPGVTVFPSQANFLLLRTPPGRAGAWFEGLKARGVLVKNMDGGHPLLADCLRITVGRPEENDAVVEGLRELAD